MPLLFSAIFRHTHTPFAHVQIKCLREQELFASMYNGNKSLFKYANNQRNKKHEKNKCYAKLFDCRIK